MKHFSILFTILFVPFLISQEEVEEVVVVGTKASIISAIEKQRESNQIVSVVDSDALGEFPDTTAAEALRRISGISVENDQGEGRYVTIRGLSGDLNTIAVNGALVPAPEGGRKVMLDGLPTELLDSIEVYKSLTPIIYIFTKVFKTVCSSAFINFKISPASFVLNLLAANSVKWL